MQRGHRGSGELQVVQELRETWEQQHTTPVLLAALDLAAVATTDEEEEGPTRQERRSRFRRRGEGERELRPWHRVSGRERSRRSEEDLRVSGSGLGWDPSSNGSLYYKMGVVEISDWVRDGGRIERALVASTNIFHFNSS